MKIPQPISVTSFRLHGQATLMTNGSVFGDLVTGSGYFGRFIDRLIRFFATNKILGPTIICMESKARFLRGLFRSLPMELIFSCFVVDEATSPDPILEIAGLVTLSITQIFGFGRSPCQSLGFQPQRNQRFSRSHETKQKETFQPFAKIGRKRISLVESHADEISLVGNSVQKDSVGLVGLYPSALNSSSQFYLTFG